MSDRDDMTEGKTQASPEGEKQRRALYLRIILRLVLLYLVPLLVLAFFFNAQYISLARDSTRSHLTVLAERQAARLDQVVGEAWNQLRWIAQHGDPQAAPDASELEAQLRDLRESNPSVRSLGVVDERGRSLGAAGLTGEAHVPVLRGEEILGQLRNSDGRVVFYEDSAEDRPRIVVAVRIEEESSVRVYWAGLTIEPLRDDLAIRLNEQGLRCAIVSDDGGDRVDDDVVLRPGGASSFHPPREPDSGSARRSSSWSSIYGYAWLTTADLAAVVHGVSKDRTAWLAPDLNRNILIFTVIFLLLVMGTIALHARTQVSRSIEVKEKQEVLSGQLVRAARLASVGELAAGIAHEINNPLAIVAEEIGLLKDLKDPEFGGELSDEELLEHFEIINDAVFRGRDITRKLLGFVRQTEVQLGELDIHELLDDVSTGYLGREFELSNVTIHPEYEAEPSVIVTDRQQLSQVLLNLMKNAIDAMGGRGTLALRTRVENQRLKISIADTGCGMSHEQMERIFTPFYTTKDPGKGTGLGLSVSQGIVESLGGEMYVDSALCEGTTFTLELPIDLDGDADA